MSGRYLSRPGRGAPPYVALVALDLKFTAPKIAAATGRTERQVWRWKAWVADHPAETRAALETILHTSPGKRAVR